MRCRVNNAIKNGQIWISLILGNPQEILKSIADRHKLEPTGDPSLQNAIEIARGSMKYPVMLWHGQSVDIVFSSHLPMHSSREIVILFGSLTTCDPGNIHETLDICVQEKIRISVIALAAEMKICRELCNKTRGETLNIF